MLVADFLSSGFFRFPRLPSLAPPPSTPLYTLPPKEQNCPELNLRAELKFTSFFKLAHMLRQVHFLVCSFRCLLFGRATSAFSDGSLLANAREDLLIFAGEAGSPGLRRHRYHHHEHTEAWDVLLDLQTARRAEIF